MSEHLQAAPGGPGIPGHPELEELAALADGKLSRVDAARVRAHLGACEECYEVFAETLHLMEELQGEEGEPGGDVVPFPFEERRQAWPWWAAAVAALLVLGLGVGLWRSRSTTPEISVASLTAPLAGRVPHLDQVAWGERNRGTGSSEERNREFRVGVEALNLQVALESGDRQSADSARAAIYGVLKDISFLDPSILKFYKGLPGAPSERVPRDFAERAAKEAEALRQSESLKGVHIDLGIWAEAGRFAAIAGVPTFFQAPSAQDLRTRLKKEEDAGLPPEVEKALEAIDRARLNPSKDYGSLKEAFEQILDYYYPQGHPIS